MSGVVSALLSRCERKVEENGMNLQDGSRLFELPVDRNIQRQGSIKRSLEYRDLVLSEMYDLTLPPLYFTVR